MASSASFWLHHCHSGCTTAITQWWNFLRHLLKRSIRSHQTCSQRFKYQLVVIMKQTKLKKHQRIKQTFSSKAFGHRCRSVIGGECEKNHFVCSCSAFELFQACHCESASRKWQVTNDKTNHFPTDSWSTFAQSNKSVLKWPIVLLLMIVSNWLAKIH